MNVRYGFSKVSPFSSGLIKTRKIYDVYNIYFLQCPTKV